MEILVHISSPSSARDDARYRAQVAAILAFQPVSRQRLAADTRDSLHPQASDSECVQASVAPISPSAPDTPGRGALSSHSALDLHPILRPSNEIAPSPSPSASDRFDHRVRGPDSLESLVSVIPDSQPEIVEPDPSQPDSWQPSKRRRIGHSANDHHPSSSSSSSASSAKRREEPHRDKSTSALTPARRSPILHPHPSSPTNAPILLSPSPFPFPLHSLPQEIHPPPPPISTASFTTHITPTLAMLTDRLNPARTYKPLHQSRPLDKLERGYWAVHLTLLRPPTPTGHEVTGEIARKSDRAQQQQQRKNAWTASVFARFWAFLSDFIGRDARAGWGVWCIVEDAGGAGGAREVVPVLLKVYAWGEVAMHVYLLLFLASERYIRGVGAQWMDSREEVVIQMA